MENLLSPGQWGSIDVEGLARVDRMRAELTLVAKELLAGATLS